MPNKRKKMRKEKRKKREERKRKLTLRFEINKKLKKAKETIKS